MKKRVPIKKILPPAILLVLAAAALLACILVMHPSSSRTVAQIYQDGVLLYEVDLDAVSESYTIEIDGEDGAENIVLVEPGQISMEYANCPDQTCVKQGAISDGAIPIVCLPHQVRISLVTGKGEDADVVA